MKKRIALVSYNNCNVNQYSVKSDPNTTQINDSNGTIAVVSERTDDHGLSVKIADSTINLDAGEAELLLTALLAHQRLQEGYNLELYKKG